MASFKRKMALDVFVANVTKRLQKYIKDANREKKWGWQSKVQPIVDEWSNLETKPTSFLDAYHTIESLCQHDLVDNFHWAATFFISEQTIEHHGYGSTLKKDLLELLKKANPYSVVYILDEIDAGERAEYTNTITFNNYEYRQKSLSYVPFYSQESKRVLDAALEDEDLGRGLVSQALDCSRNRDFAKVLKDYQENKDKDTNSMMLVM